MGVERGKCPHNTAHTDRKRKLPPPFVTKSIPFVYYYVSTNSNLNNNVMATTDNIKPTEVYFCTYKNRETNGWLKSREYPTIDMLMDKMKPYMVKHPRTTVQFQTRMVYI